MNRIDLNWDDNEVLPDRIRPDVEFLFYRMSRATIDMVDPGQDERILDIGCGRAIDIVNMSGSGATLIGIEPSFVMISHALETLKLDGQNLHVLQSIGESIPVVAASIDKVVCKGALDHFADPGKALQEMAQVIKPGGYAVVAIANFDSLGFRLGKLIFWVRRILKIKNPYKRLPWEPPPDHTIKFNYTMLLKLAGQHMKVEKVTGVSLLCCTPGWGDLLARLPAGLAKSILRTADAAARLLPWLSDVIVLKCAPAIRAA
jgi:ubiquinone/menaquinone biosynthesis C-methylase UbiE